MINYKFCPQCKSDLAFTDEHYYCANCQINIYINSKPCVTVLPLKGGKVLLSKRGIEPYKGDWDTIGGFLKSGEPPEAGALREAKEETGLTMKLTKLFGIYMDKYGVDGEDVQTTVYLAEVHSGVLKPQDDVASLEWVDIKQNKIVSRFKSVEKVLADLKNLYP